MTSLATTISSLPLPTKVRRDLVRFCEQLVDLYGQDLLSLTVIGSAAGTSYREKESDLNLLVVYSDLNVADLAVVAGLARRWLRKRRFAPRFLSRRNLLTSARVFPLDTLDMLERRVVLFGEDLVAQCVVDRQALGWQVSSELKAMRLRIKQQFWRTSGDRKTMAAVVAHRYGSLMLLARGLLVLADADPGSDTDRIQRAMADLFGVSPQRLVALEEVRRGPVRWSSTQALQAFSDLMDVIRVLDDQAERYRS